MSGPRRDNGARRPGTPSPGPGPPPGPWRPAGTASPPMSSPSLPSRRARSPRPGPRAAAAARPAPGPASRTARRPARTVQPARQRAPRPVRPKVFFFSFDLVPVPLDLVGAGDGHVPEHMRMPPHQLGYDPIRPRPDRPEPRTPRPPGKPSRPPPGRIGRRRAHTAGNQPPIGAGGPGLGIGSDGHRISWLGDQRRRIRLRILFRGRLRLLSGRSAGCPRHHSAGPSPRSDRGAHKPPEAQGTCAAFSLQSGAKASCVNDRGGCSVLAAQIRRSFGHINYTILTTAHADSLSRVVRPF